MPWTRAGRERLGTLPFEAAIGFLVIVSGIAGLFRFGVTDPLAKLLPTWENVTFDVVYLAAGLGIVVGLSRARARSEGGGLILLGAAVVVRAVVYLVAIGLDAKLIVSLVFDVVILWASIRRLRSLIRGEVIVKATA
jgi:hypothetical protein